MAVIVRRFSFSVRIDDSKKLTFRQREFAFREILTRADIGIGFSVPEEIDRFGVAVRQKHAFEDVSEELGDVFVFVHLLNAFSIKK